MSLRPTTYIIVGEMFQLRDDGIWVSDIRPSITMTEDQAYSYAEEQEGITFVYDESGRGFLGIIESEFNADGFDYCEIDPDNCRNMATEFYNQTKRSASFYVATLWL